MASGWAVFAAVDTIQNIRLSTYKSIAYKISLDNSCSALYKFALNVKKLYDKGTLLLKKLRSQSPDRPDYKVRQ